MEVECLGTLGAGATDPYTGSKKKLSKTPQALHTVKLQAHVNPHAIIGTLE